VGKLTLAALEATLTLFLDQATAMEQVPTLRMLRRSLPELVEQAERIAAAVNRQVPEARVSAVDGFSQMGSGSLPTQDLPTRLVEIDSGTSAAQRLATQLRRGKPPIFTRLHKGRVLVDPRTLLDGEEEIVVAALVDVLK
jgi:L-seryl-tRNA(Ser) seleniumtransferase